MMNEREVLNWLSESVEGVGDDCAVIPFRDTHLIFTIDMLWSETDFPTQITPYTIGWRTVAVSLSDIAAMGAKPLGVVAALGAPEFESEFLSEILRGGRDCCKLVGTDYVGGDLSAHSSLTLTSSALGEAERPVLRSGAQVGDLVCVTGSLGRTAAALKLFERGNTESANKLFQFTPRISEALQLAPVATSMMDISDGLARSLYQLGKASSVGFKVDAATIPYCEELTSVTTDQQELKELGIFTGEDFELLFTLDRADVKKLPPELGITVIGEVQPQDEGIILQEKDGLVTLENRGYEHHG